MQLTKTKYINIAIRIALTFIIALCPPVGKITPYGMKALGVFVSVLYGWLTVDLLFPSIWGFASIAVLGLMSSADSLSVGLGNTQVVAILAAMAFAGALDAVGVTKAIANWMLTKEIMRKSPWLLVIGIVATSFVLGIAGAALAAMLLLWQILGQIADKGNIPKGDGLLSFMLIMVTLAAFCGMFALPFHATTMIFVGYFIQTIGSGFETVPFMIVALTTFLVVLTAMVLLGKFVFRFDASKFIMPQEVIEEMKNEKVSFETKVGLIVLVVYMLALIVPSVFTSLPGAAICNALGVAGLSIIGMMVLAVVSIGGNSVINLGKVWTKYTEWPLVLLLAVTFPIAEVIRSADAGIMPTVMGVVLPIVSKMGILPFMIAVIIVLGLLTQVTHNIVLAAMFTPFLIPLCAQMGGNIYTMWFIMFFALNASYVTPAASFQSAMVFGLERMSSKWAYILGTAILIVTWIVCIIVTIPLANALF